MVASADHLKKSGALEKKVLLVVTDGEDNASRESLEQALRRLDRNRTGRRFTPSALLGDEHSKRARRALREMAEDTGGVAFFPKDLSEVQAITQQIAHDIRNQYTIVYKPSNAAERRRLSHGKSGSQRQGIQEAAGAHAQRILCREQERTGDPTRSRKVKRISSKAGLRAGGGSTTL